LTFSITIGSFSSSLSFQKTNHPKQRQLFGVVVERGVKGMKKAIYAVAFILLSAFCSASAALETQLFYRGLISKVDITHKCISVLMVAIKQKRHLIAQNLLKTLF
jgi:hypothetical protein